MKLTKKQYTQVGCALLRHLMDLGLKNVSFYETRKSVAILAKVVVQVMKEQERTEKQLRRLSKKIHS
jgi:hypothetical protein